MKKLLLTGLIAISFLASLQPLQAQTAPVKRWDKTFGGSNWDGISTLKQASDGGYILCGTSESGISGDKSQPSKGIDDYWVIKLDANGNKIWDKTFGGGGSERLTTLQHTSDGGYILGGSSNSPSSGDKSQASKGDWDYWIVKIDASGNKTWDKTFGGSGFDRLSSLQQTSDGGYILGGSSNSPSNGDKSQASKGWEDFWVLKLDTNGNKIWDKTLGGSDYDFFSSLQQTSDGGFILGGYTGGGISGDKSQATKGSNDYWVVKLDATGNKIWDKDFGGTDIDNFSSLQQTSDGGYILGGYSASGISGDKSQPSKGWEDYWVVKLDTNGNKIWDKTFGGIWHESLNSLQQTIDGGYILGGHSNSPQNSDKSQASQGDYDYWMLKLDANGNKTWDKTLGGSDYDALTSLLQSSDGGYILGGASISGISGDKTQTCRGEKDFWVVKLGGNTTGIRDPEVAFPISIYPNPSKGKFNLQLNNICVSAVEVTVSDMFGRVVTQPEIQISGQQISKELILPSVKGIYFLQIKAGEQISTHKIVVE